MLLLGIDIGTSSVKVSAVDAQSRKVLQTVQYPNEEATIIAKQTGWAEQLPDDWWYFVQMAVEKLRISGLVNILDVAAIGIAYQMHGLVCINKDQKVLRPAIIWCDSRAIAYGEQALEALGADYCQQHLLNSPGNFTAAKLAWVKENEPEVFEQIDKIMLPGDYLAMRLTGEITTTVAALSEGIFWDFKRHAISKEVLQHFEFEAAIIPKVQNVFSVHGTLLKSVAALLGMRPGIPVTYKAGDQPNNAFSLNVNEPGEVAATAGTSGVIYAIGDQLTFDQQSRVNTFAHVQHQQNKQRLGVLLCINGTGILNSWVRQLNGKLLSYSQMNALAANIAPGSDGLHIFPFGNGAERMLENKIFGGQWSGINFSTHTPAHIFRAVQEGIVFAFQYGMKILQQNGIQPTNIRAGKANLFQSEVFTQAFVDVTGVPLSFYRTDGSAGAAIGAGVGAGIYDSISVAFDGIAPIGSLEPGKDQHQYQDLYQQWENALNNHLSNI